MMNGDEERPVRTADSKPFSYYEPYLREMKLDETSKAQRQQFVPMLDDWVTRLTNRANLTKRVALWGSLAVLIQTALVVLSVVVANLIVK